MSPTENRERESSVKPKIPLSQLDESTFSGPSLQERHSPGSICFGCGPSNSKGLHIRSFPQGNEVVARWQAESHHEAFPGMLNGGIIGALLDCHCTTSWVELLSLLKSWW